AFANVGAEIAGFVEQHLVELSAAHVERGNGRVQVTEPVNHAAKILSGHVNDVRARIGQLDIAQTQVISAPRLAVFSPDEDDSHLLDEGRTFEVFVHPQVAQHAVGRRDG